jgi:hypothetical protein
MAKILFFMTIGLLLTAVTAGYWALLAVMILLLGLGLAWAIPHYLLLPVPELEVAVVYDQTRQGFSRFLANGRHWLRPFEQAVATIPLTGQTAGGQSHGVQTSGGLPLSITWSVAYQLEPLRVQPDKQANAARVLPDKSAVVVGKHMGNILHHVLGAVTIEALCQPGSHQRLERQIRQQLTIRLHDLGLAFTRVMLGPIEMPAKVQAALATAHERRLQTELEAAALTRLHEAVSQFSDSDMARLVELERIHALSQQGVALVYTQPVREEWAVVKNQWPVAN